MAETGPPESKQTPVEELFAVELQTFERLLPQLLETSRGDWALIQKTELGGIFPDQADAINAGYKRYGTELFFTRQILEE